MTVLSCWTKDVLIENRKKIARGTPLFFMTPVCGILPWGEYSYLRIPMGVVCTQSMLQLIMTETLRGLDILVYINDILVIQKEHESASGHLIKVEYYKAENPTTTTKVE